MNVREIMTENPITVTSRDSLYDAMNRMLESDIRHLPVVEGGELVGMLSDRDFRRFSFSLIDGAAQAKERFDAPVASLIQGDVLSVGAEDELTDAIDVLIEHRVGAVPVVDETGDGLVGILSYVDVLRAAREVL